MAFQTGARYRTATPRSGAEPHGTAAPGPGEIHVCRIELGGGGRGAARAGLHDVLAGYLGGEDVALAEGPGGKPRLARGPERLSFNLSHSGALALVAIAPGGVEIGVDVERLRPRRDLVRLAARRLPEDDAAAIAAAEPDAREAAFYAAWTRHEARVKCTGTGLAGPPPGPEVVAHQLPIDAGYAAAVAVSRGGEGAAACAPRILLRDAACRR
ncbi:MAG TPA: 4'-phosphopantetheinyl transferase superfamily protein [Solirubrobacterales bacterium]